MSRDNLFAAADNIDATQVAIVSLLSDVLPIFGQMEVDLSFAMPDYNSLSDDELSEYVAGRSNAIREFVSDFVEKISPEIQKPTAKLAMKMISGMLG